MAVPPHGAQARTEMFPPLKPTPPTAVTQNWLKAQEVMQYRQCVNKSQLMCTK